MYKYLDRTSTSWSKFAVHALVILLANSEKELCFPRSRMLCIYILLSASWT